MRTRRLGLALGGGGIKGAAHIGVLKVLEKAGYRPDIIAGSSIGAIIAGLYACGFSADDIFAITGQFARERPVNFGIDIPLILELACKWIGKKLNILRDDLPLPRGIIDNQKIVDFLYKLTEGKTLQDAETSLIITATELHRGQLYLFASGNAESKFKDDIMDLERDVNWEKYAVKVWPDQELPIASAMVASSSIPGIFTPREFGDLLFIDGGVLNNVPADLLWRIGAEPVVAVDLGFSFQDDLNILDPIDVLLQSSDIMGTYITKTRLEGYASIIITPDLEGYGVKDLPHYEEIVKAGEKAALKALPRLQRYYQNGKGSLR